MDANHVGSNYPNEFGNFRLASLPGQSLATTGDTNLVVMEASKYIVRRITLTNFSGNAAAANVGVYTAATRGGTAIAAVKAYTGADSTSAYVDMTLSAAANANVVTTQALFFNIANAASVTCDVNLYGDIVSL
jgi:hypothetical protein